MFYIPALISYVLPSFISKVSNKSSHISQGILEGLLWASMVVGVVIDDSVATIIITSSMLIII